MIELPEWLVLFVGQQVLANEYLRRRVEELEKAAVKEPEEIAK